MNLPELTAIREALKASLARYEQITPCCTTCEHLTGGQYCKQFDSHPPQQWLDGPVDCPRWTWDAIPF